MVLTLRRELRENCALGFMLVFGESFPTIERPWRASADGPGGMKGVSCVPPGKYELEKHDSDAHGRTFALVNWKLDVFHFDGDVPNERRGIARTAVLIHAANYVSELRGCIAPGLAHAEIVSNPGVEQFMVTHSRNAMQRIHALVPWIDGHELEITLKPT